MGRIFSVRQNVNIDILFGVKIFDGHNTHSCRKFDSLIFSSKKTRIDFQSVDGIQQTRELSVVSSRAGIPSINLESYDAFSGSCVLCKKNTYDVEFGQRVLKQHETNHVQCYFQPSDLEKNQAHFFFHVSPRIPSKHEAFF